MKCLTCGVATANPKFCSMACIRGKHTTPHTETTKRKISRSSEGKINLGNQYRDGKIKIKFAGDLKNDNHSKIEDQLGRAKGPNRKHVIKFYNQCMADGLAGTSTLKYVYEVNALSEMLGKDFTRATKDDIVRLCGQIEARDVGERTKGRLKITLKKLYKIIEGDNEEYPKKVRWIKVKSGVERKLPESIMTERDVREIVKTCRHLREKSFVAMLYLSGCRCSELLGIRIRDMTFDRMGVILMVNGSKTAGSRRRVRILSGIKLLESWMRKHPNPEPDSLVWMMGYWQARNLMRKLKRRMGSKGFHKPIHAHAFRHARATYLAGQGLNSFQLMSMFGWRKPETANWYISLSGKQLDDSLCALPRMVF